MLCSCRTGGFQDKFFVNYWEDGAGKRFRRFRVPIQVRFLGLPEIAGSFLPMFADFVCCLNFQCLGVAFSSLIF